MIYYLLFFLLALCVVLSATASKKQTFFLTFISFVLVVLFQGLRWERGTDWDPYYYMFYFPADPKWYYEYGWYQFNHLVYELTGSFTVRLVVESAAILLLYLRFAKYIGLHNTSAIVLSCFASSIFPVRFALASGIVLNSYQYLIDKNIWKYVLLILLASTIHMACLLVLPIYFFPRRSFELRTLLGLYFSSIIFSYASNTVLSYLILFNSILGAGMDSDLQDKVGGYLEEGISDYSVRSVLSIFLSYINAAFFIWLFWFFLNKMKRNEKIISTIKGKQMINKYTVLLNLYVFGLCLNRIVQFSVPYLSRIGILISAGFTWMLLMGIEKLYPKQKCLLYFVWVLYIFIIYYSILNGQYHKLFVPYKSIIN